MTLEKLVDTYSASRDVCASYVDQLHWFVHALEKTENRILSVADLCAELINRHLQSVRDKIAPETRKNRRRMFLTLWQAAADAGLTGEPNRRKVMRIKIPAKVQRAWTIDQMRTLLHTSEQWPGRYPCGIARSRYWCCYIMAAWDSGLRGCDLRRIRRDEIARNGRLVIVQHKTGRLIRLQFRPQTLAAIAESFPPDRELVWPLFGRLATWRREASRLVHAAGLQGTIGRIRHSSGTAVELKFPGQGHEHLGNTRAIFERHYLDHQKVAEVRILPDSLV